MDHQRAPFQFRLSQLLGIMLAAALLSGAYRAHQCILLLVAWVEYAAALVFIASLLKWSDIAVSVCFLLIVLPLVIVPMLPITFP